MQTPAITIAAVRRPHWSEPILRRCVALAAAAWTALAFAAFTAAAPRAQEAPPLEPGWTVQAATKLDADGRALRHGAFRALREDGSVAWEGRCDEGLRAGVWSSYHANGALAARGQYLNGLKHHLWECFWPDGALRARGKYRLDLRDGAWKEWNADRSLDARASGEYTQLVEKWPEDTPKLRVESRAGLAHGRSTAYWKNGAPAFAGNCVDGKRVGNWRLRHADGSLDAELLSGWYEDGRWVGALRAEPEALPQERRDASGAAETRLTGLFRFARGTATEAEVAALEQRLAKATLAEPDAWRAAQLELVGLGRAAAPRVWNSMLEAARRPDPSVHVLARHHELLAALTGLEGDALYGAPPADLAAARRSLQRWALLLRTTESDGDFESRELPAWQAQRTPEVRNTILAGRFDAWIGLPRSLTGLWNERSAAPVTSQGGPAAARDADRPSSDDPPPLRRGEVSEAELAERDRRYFEDRAREQALEQESAQISIETTTALAHRRLDTALDWLLRHQLASGEFPTLEAAAPCESGAAACTGFGPAHYAEGTTALALLALQGAPPGPRDERRNAAIGRGLAWLITRQDAATGAFGEREPDHSPYQQALCTWALCEVAHASPDGTLRAAARRGLDACIEMRTVGSGWGYPREQRGGSNTSATAWMVLALDAGRRAKFSVPQQAFADAATWVRTATEPLGTRTGYDAVGNLSSRIRGVNDLHDPSKGEALTAAGLVVRLLCGDLERPGIDNAAPRQEYRLQARAPRWSPATQDCDTYAWYFGAQALCRLKSNYWAAWWEKLVAQMDGALRADGCARGSIDPVDPWGIVAGRVYSTALVALTLETQLRYGDSPAGTNRSADDSGSNSNERTAK
jgi:antitoxin component YwqK of YwqJK toxin-antitoxin module